MQKRKKFDCLDIRDDYMFCCVFRKPELCKKFLETVLHIRIKKIMVHDMQKTFKEGYGEKGIRLDVFVVDDEGRKFDIEMQNIGVKNLPQRIRYYHSVIDRAMLDSGADYGELSESYVIFVCMEDIFKKNRNKYTFDYSCREDPNIRLGDGSAAIVLYPFGEVKEQDCGLDELLDYLGSGKVTGSFTREIEKEVERVKKDDGYRKEYDVMLTIEEQAYAKGKAEEKAEDIAILAKYFQTTEGLSETEAQEKAKLALQGSED